MAQVHKAGAVSSCSNEVAGHNELEEFSQRNSFAYFCFGFLCKCFFSALVDGFQTEGTLGNEREKAVTHCTRCQGMAVTHGSWRGPRGAPRQRCCAEPPSPGPCRPRPGCPSAPAAALGRCLPAPAAASPLTPKAGGDHSTPPTEVTLAGATSRGQAAAPAAPPETSPLRAGTRGGRRAVWTWQLHSTACSRGRRHVVEHSIVWRLRGRPGHAESGEGEALLDHAAVSRGASLLLRRMSYSQQPLPGALGKEVVRFDQLEFIS